MTLFSVLAVLHGLTHDHRHYKSPSLGEFAWCGWRMGRSVTVAYRPALAGADWHVIPSRDGDDPLMESTLARMLASDTPEQAMAVLREVPDGE